MDEAIVLVLAGCEGTVACGPRSSVRRRWMLVREAGGVEPIVVRERQSGLLQQAGILRQAHRGPGSLREPVVQRGKRRVVTRDVNRKQ